MMEYPTFVSSLAAMAESEDPVAQAIALETVGYIGVSLEGKVRTLMKWARTFPHLAIAEPKSPVKKTTQTKTYLIRHLLYEIRFSSHLRSWATG